MTPRTLLGTREELLGADPVIERDHPEVRARATSLVDADVHETARRCFEWVRDTIAHASDHRRSPTTCSASEVLREGSGFCYAKSHLLVALLRANGIPAGLCYQRLTIDGPTGPCCLHGYVAMELPGGWYAVDPRGNKPGVDARFEPPHERLAFPIVNEGERDFPLVFARPLEVVVRCLRENGTWEEVLAGLPDAEELGAENPSTSTEDVDVQVDE